MDDWPGKLSRRDAIRILDMATDKYDPYWEYVVEDFYHEATDTMPSIYHTFAAIGITEAEYREATDSQDANIPWPADKEQE